jgi:hypothetical protein
MTRAICLFPPESPACRALQAAAERARCVVICGIPGTGKSLLLREQAILADAQGRTVHRLQWDVARQPFDRPDILKRYPEIDGSTHPVIRQAAGLWVRGAIAGWFQQQSDPGQLLLIEAPLVGARFIELAQVMQDDAEPHLAASTTVYLVPVPSREVRAAIEAARVREIAQPRHARDAANAIPALVDRLWLAVVGAARDLKLPGAAAGDEYSPELYADLYRHVLRHRHVSAVPIDEIVPSSGSPHELERPTPEVAPHDAEVTSLMQEAAPGSPAEEHAILHACNAWYQSV